MINRKPFLLLASFSATIILLAFPNEFIESENSQTADTTEFSADANSLRIAAFGDFSANSNTQAVSNLVMSLSADIIITLGDNNYGVANYEDNVAQYYSAYIGGYSGQYPSGPSVSNNRFFPSLGNHDWDDSGIASYEAFFTLPGISVSSSGNERYYDFTNGPVHFFCIDSDPHEPHGRSSASTQAQWLQAQLAASSYCWKIVYTHYPPYSSGDRHGSETIMRWPYEDWGASAVLAAHDHTYERIHRDDNNDGNELLYFVCGTGGRSLYGFGTPVGGSQFRYSSNYGTMLINASASSLTFEFWSIAGGGTLIDNITIQSSGTCSANCNDGNPCTVDEDNNGQCAHTPIICSDNNSCTTDACVSGQCVYTLLCNDGDACTTDNCSNGQCSYSPISNCNCQLRIESLTLVNSASDNDIRLMNDNDTVNLAVTPSITIRANPCQLPIGSVKFQINGSTFRTENTAPYSLAGDNSGNYNKWNVAPGLYTLTATPYSGANAGGAAGTGKTVTIRMLNQLNLCANDAACNDNNSCTFDKCSQGQCILTPIPGCCQTNADCNDGNPCTTDQCSGNQCSHTISSSPCCQSNADCNDNNLCTTDVCSQGNCSYAVAARIVNTFTLVNADSDNDIGALNNGSVIYLGTTPSVNVRANLCTNTGTGSVRFKLNGSIFRTEGSAPFSLAGDNNGNYNKWNVAPGTYALEAIPYAGANAGGTIGTGKTITITVMTGAAKTELIAVSSTGSTDEQLKIYPNPNSGHFLLEWEALEQNDWSIRIYNQLGQIVYSDVKLQYPGEMKETIHLNSQSSGIYFLRLSSGNKVFNQKFVVSQ